MTELEKKISPNKIYIELRFLVDKLSIEKMDCL